MKKGGRTIELRLERNGDVDDKGNLSRAFSDEKIKEG